MALPLSMGCATVLFTRTPESRTYTEPVYEVRQPSFFFGLVNPDYDLYLDKICLGKDIDQAATQYTAEDVLATVFTVGIYAPRTIQIWCKL